MKAGDRFVVEVEYTGGDADRAGQFRLPNSKEGFSQYYTREEIETAAAAYAAKQPAPVPSDWQPKEGERVLVEVIYNGHMDSTGDVSVYIPYHVTDVGLTSTAVHVDPACIIGPAPERKPAPRFEAGERVFDTDKMQPCDLVRFDDGWMATFPNGLQYHVTEDDLITLAEARERLAK